MDKFWLVAKQEYLNRILKRSFMIGTLIIPVMIAVIIGVTILIIRRSQDHRPFGYVDLSGELASAHMPVNHDGSVEIISFKDEDSARMALDLEEIQAYHIIPEDYLNHLYVDLYYLEEPPSTRVLNDFDDFMRANILKTTPTQLQIRIIEGSNLTVKSIDRNRIFQDNQYGIITMVFPMIIGMFFLFIAMGASGYFLQVVTDEKENRTMEILITSISPIQLIGGKSVGLVAVGLTQISVWLTSIVIAWIIAQQFIESLNDIRLPWDILIIFAIFLLPSYAIIGGIMVCIGSIVTEFQEGQQISGMLSLLFTFPIFFTALVFANPNSPLLIFLSFWPTTSAMTIIMRWGFTVIPFWQISISLLICVISGIFIIWIASRLFRMGMLRYGQRITFNNAIGAIRSRNQ